ncbi:MAG TPA: hypothetical protein P5044_11655 [bacterium]|nr:hypothetical protein [bacterium]
MDIPKDMSPGFFRYIAEMNCDPRCLGANTVSLAQKGFINIRADRTCFILSKTLKTIEPGSLFYDELLVYNDFFAESDVFTISNQRRTDVSNLFIRLSNYFHDSRKPFFDGLMFNTHSFDGEIIAGHLKELEIDLGTKDNKFLISKGLLPWVVAANAQIEDSPGSMPEWFSIEEIPDGESYLEKIIASDLIKRSKNNFAMYLSETIDNGFLFAINDRGGF